jgi:hypothetical protein
MNEQNQSYQTNAAPENKPAAPTVLMLRREHDIGEFSANNDNASYYVNKVHYNAPLNRMEATDGSIAIWVSAKDHEDSGFLPPADCVPLESAYISSTHLTGAIKGLSKPASSQLSRPTDRVRWHVGRNGRVSLTSVSKDAVKVIEVESARDYVNLASVISQPPAQLTVHIGVKYLLKIARYLHRQKVVGGSVKMEFCGPMDAIRFSARTEHNTIDGVVMPMKA